MKKVLIVSILVLAIATSLVAGTLAVYTKTLDFNGAMTAKTFDIRETNGEDVNIELAPTESDRWVYKLTNTTETGAVTEVGMGVSTSVTIPVAFVDHVKVELFYVDENNQEVSLG